MIVVLGRPHAVRPPLQPADAPPVPGGLCVAIARAAVGAGARVEIVGAIGDDAAGDAVVVGLARAGVGHAALLRQPVPARREGAVPGQAPAVRLDAGDVELGLGYILEFGVLVLAEELDPAAEAAALDAAAYRGARVIAVLPTDATPGERLAATATVVAAPPDDGGAFPEMLGRYAAELDRGSAPAESLERAAAAVGWERRS